MSDAGQISALASLHVSNFRRYFVGQTLSSVGTWFHTLAMALVAVELSGSGTTLGVIVALQWLPLLLFGAHAGAVIDRYDPRRVLMATNGVNAALAGLMVAISAAGWLSTSWLGVFSLALGFVLPFDRPAVQMMPVELVEPSLVSNALGLSSITQSLARLVGPALAGMALALAGPSWCFTINAGSFLVALWFVWRLDVGALFPRERSASVRGQVGRAFTYVARDRDLRAVVLTNALIGVLAVNFLVVITAMVQLHFGAGEFAVGIGHAANAAGAVVGGVLAGAWLARVSRRLDLVCLALGASLALLAVAPTLAVFVALGPLLGVSFVAYQAAVLDSCHRLARPEMLGRVVGLVTVGTFGTRPIGSVLVGVIIDGWSSPAALGVGAVACVGGAVILAIARRATPSAPDDPRSGSCHQAPARGGSHQNLKYDS